MTQVTKAGLLARVEALEKSLKRETAFRNQEAGERKRLEKALAEALDQQTATAEILRMISASPSDVSPVFRAIVRSATRLCDATFGTVFRFDGELITVAANQDLTAEEITITNTVFPAPATRGIAAGRAIVDRAVVHITDIRNDPDYVARPPVNALGYRTALAVPMLREGSPIGVFVMWRREVRPFTDKQIELVRTFADQAVIAIENVRLFKELEARNHDLSEALDRQTATADVLRIIAQSPTELQPVLEAIATSALRLCTASDVVIERLEGDRFYNAAHAGAQMKGLVGRPLPLTRSFPGGRAILDRKRIVIDDIQLVAESEYPDTLELLKLNTVHSCAEIPLLSEGKPLGNLAVLRAEVRPFTDGEITLLETFADQAVIAIENVRLFNELEGRNRDLTEALDRQTATAEILRVISRSQTNVQPVFDTIADNAVSLFRPWSVAVYRFDGECVHVAAVRGGLPGSEEYLRGQGPRRPTRNFMAGRCIIECSVVHIPDFETAGDVPAAAREIALLRGFKATLTVPMLKDGQPIGVISVSRSEAGAFSQAEIDLLQTFADQAVIAIENVRLFTELQEKNRALTRAHGQVTEALEQQTATSEILAVISRSPTEVEPVFAAVVASAARLCEAHDVAMLLVDGDDLRLAAGVGPLYMSMPSDFRIRITRDSAATRAVVDRVTVHIHDFAAEPEDEYPVGRELARRFGHRTMLAVPLLREGVPIGVICAFRLEVRPFPDNQIELLKTFADQAVIAIENVRLFDQVQARTRELTEALEYQTATSDVLTVISRSPTDAQPVFDMIAESAARLCEAQYCFVYRFEDQLLHFVAHHSLTAEVLEINRRAYPAPPSRKSVAARAVLERSVVQIPDVNADPDYALGAMAAAGGYHSAAAVPILRDGLAIGSIAVTRAQAGLLPDRQIELLKTFADQAVIAIENVRLFKELEARTGELTQSVEKLTALGEVSHVLSSTLDLDTVLTTIVNRAVHLSGADGGQIFEYDEVAEEFQPRASNEVEEVVAATQHTRLRKGEGAVGRMAVTREAVQIPDIALEGAYESRARGALLRSGRHALLAVPLLSEEHIVGGLVISRNAAGAFPVEIVELLKTFATQSALAIQNARLFHEIEDKSRQLEAASRHKSEFLANMSHELRTPLNAVIGFSEVLLQRMFGALNDKQDEYLKDIYASGQHLLSLINDILDLSKIEAGRMELVPAPFHLPTALENAVILVRERAARHGIALHLDLDPRLDQLVADERKVKQVLLNLLSNAVKFTPEGGRITVKAGRTDGAVEIAVSDTGIGIAPEDQAAIFEEFRQVGTDDARKLEGTGLGLTLAKKFVELHGGRLWVESELGRGSTFTFTLPVS